MTDTADVAVQLALMARMAAMTTSPDVFVAYPNTVFSPPDPNNNVYWYRVNFLPAPKRALGIDDGSSNQIEGIMQVDAVTFPGGGEPPVARLAQNVAAWFPRGTILTKDSQQVRIRDAPYRGRLMMDDPWVFIPVSVPYQAFSINPA